MPALIVAVPLLGIILFLVSYGMVQSVNAWHPQLNLSENAIVKALTSPLQLILNAINGAVGLITDALNKLVDGHSTGIVNLLTGAVWSWNQWLNEQQLFSRDMVNTLDHAFTVALPDAFDAARGYVDVGLASAASDLGAFKTTVANDLKAAATTASNESTAAYNDATTYADAAATNAVSLADQYTDFAVGSLHDSVTASLNAVDRLVNAAQTAADNALGEATSIVNDVIPPITAQVGGLAAATEGLIGTTIPSIEAGLSDFEKYVGSLGLPALIAAVPALGLLVNTIASESGLNNQACRSKVKGICGTDPNVWGDLLGLLAPVLLTFDFKALYDTANAIAGEAAAIVKQAA